MGEEKDWGVRFGISFSDTRDTEIFTVSVRVGVAVWVRLARRTRHH